MTNVIVVTSIKEQQDMMSSLLERLKVFYVTDTSINVVKANMSRVDVRHTVKSTTHIAASYHVILIPISISLDNITGFSPKTNFNVNLVLKRLDAMKSEVIHFVNQQKIVSQTDRLNQKKFKDAINRLFEGE